MDIFDKAQDLLDRAQEKVADATTMAAWRANKAVRQRAAQTQKEEIEKQIGTTTMQLGHRVYQLWRNRDSRDDPALEELCRALDNLLGRYREVNAEMAEINNTAYEGMALGPRSAGPPGTATVLPAGTGGAPQAQLMSPAPRQAPPPPQREESPPPASRQAPPAPPPSQREESPPPPPRQATPAPPQAAAEPARPASKPKPCPSCGTTVPADMMYCPHCGYMAR